MSLVTRLWNEESGQGMVEYGLILALVSVVVITVLGLIGTNLKDRFTDVNNKLQTSSE
jgi:pilus assembly protein Flp/PilA